MLEPYFADDTVQLYLGDSRDILPALGITADLVLADPPYGETSLQWDRWPDGWVKVAADVTRSLWCFGSMRMFLQHGREFEDAGWKLSQDIIWQKNTGSSLVADRFRRIHEHVLHWYRGQWRDVHHEAIRVPHDGPNWGRRRNGTSRAQHFGGIRQNTPRPADPLRLPSRRPGRRSVRRIRLDARRGPAFRSPGDRYRGERGVRGEGGRSPVAGAAAHHHRRGRPVMKPPIRCKCCDQFGPHKAHGWCCPCYLRWLKAGKPEGGPPPRHPDPVAAAAEGRRRAAQARREDYQELRSWGETREQAAARVGVCHRTTERYDRALREQGAA